MNMKKFFTILLIANLFVSLLHAEEILEQDSVKVSKKIITINQEAIRAPASSTESNSKEENETLAEAMEGLEEEPKLWFNP